MINKVVQTLSQSKPHNFFILLTVKSCKTRVTTKTYIKFNATDKTKVRILDIRP